MYNCGKRAFYKRAYGGILSFKEKVCLRYFALIRAVRVFKKEYTLVVECNE